MKKINFILLLSVIVAINSCKKPYNPPAIASTGSYLVVEGVIDPGVDSTVIRLSKTVNLSASVSSNPVLSAHVTILSNGGSIYAVNEIGNGYYKALLKLPISNTYQVKIITSDNQTYASDLVPVKNALGIDTITTSIKSNGVQINLNTHNQSGNSRYYRWTYNETYLIHTPFYSAYKLQATPNDTIVSRPFSEQISTCWITDTSSTIILGSTAKLSQDVVNQQPIVFLPMNSEKINDLYSIDVQQYALSSDAFNYYTQLEKNTEQLGTIFDAQPSELVGNIHCTSNPAQTVVGYISVGSYSQKRIFVDSRSLPSWLSSSPYGGCTLDTLLFKAGKTQENQVAESLFPGYQLPVASVTVPFTSIILGYSGGSPFCTDCTLRGTNVKPSFWP